MAVVQQIVIDKMINFLDDLIHKGKVKLNGQYKDYEIYRTFKEGNTLRKYLYLETEVGMIDEAQLISFNNEILAIKPYSIDKKDDGIVLAFEFKLSAEEVSA